MELLELNLKHFGKFLEHKVSLGPGVNVICGGNETGKTTMHAFIRDMFFGIRAGRGRNGKNDEYFLRQPWDNPGYFAGALRLSYRGEIYRIERNFLKSAREVRLICESSGQEMAADAGQLSELLGGLSETAFVNTVFIPQTGSETDAGLAQELQKYMVNFQETGDGNLDLSRAVDQLKGKRKQVENKKRQEQEVLEEKISKKRMEEQFVREELEKMKRRGSGREGNEKYRTGGKEGRQRELDIPLPGALNGCQEPERGGEEEKKEMLEPAFRRFLIWLNILLFLCGILSVACGVFAAVLPGKISFFLLGALFLCLFGMAANYSRKQMIHGSGKRRMQADNEPGLRSEREYLRRDAETEEKAPREGALGEKEFWKKEIPEEAVQEAAFQKKAFQEKTLQLTVIQEELEELYETHDRLAAYDQELDALDLAMVRIKELSERIYREAGTEFGRKASEILVQLTEGRYTQIALDEKMQVRINTPSSLLYLHQVSYGTMNQIYFALRIAAGELLGFGEPLPVILDEAFAMYDDKRLEAALRWLDRSGRQVILFSCQKRELEILERIRREC